MGSIRSDLVGMVFIPTDGGDVLRLAAGDVIPEGVVVGEHLIEPDDTTEAEVDVKDSDDGGTGDGEPVQPSEPDDTTEAPEALASEVVIPDVAAPKRRTQK